MTLNWGNYPRVTNQKILHMHWRDEIPFDITFCDNLLPHGNGRSYGDSCLNQSGTLLSSNHLNHFIAFDASLGILRCESGVLLADILSLIVPKGWILPVMPGTKFVTLGGAIANDVHGKNHHHAGTFGCHILRFELLRSNGERLICSNNENTNVFRATIGGLGLTGFIVWAEIQLQALHFPFLETQTIPFVGINDFLKLSKDNMGADYTVAWLDCQARGKYFSRGLFTLASTVPSTGSIQRRKERSIPFYFPSMTLNQVSMSWFNTVYYYLGTKKETQTQYYDHYFFPLDSIRYWNKIYGRKGFLQYQFVLPWTSLDALQDILKKISTSKLASFLSVLKTFGDKASPGLLSFPMPGITLALDFPNRKSVFRLLNELDNIVMAANGRVYIAKDARMSSQAFQRYYPQFDEFSKFIDPKFSSDFWSRVNPL